MKTNSDPFAPENITLSPEQEEAFKNGGRLEMWDGIPVVIEALPVPEGKTQKKHKWVGYTYKEQLELARQTRIPLLVVQAELHRLHFQAWDKKARVEFNNSVLSSLGFSHHDKRRALKALENAKWITVQWRKRKPPLVTILKGFYHGS